MSLLRPAARAALIRWREVLAAVALAGAGLWLMRLGGWLLGPLGGLILVTALGWAVTALRRLRFQREVAAPGLVEVDEGAIGYLGPNFGGYLALADLAEIRLVDHFGARHWRLRQGDGQMLLIPVAAQGAAGLYDAFSTLPGINIGLLGALLHAPEAAGLVWQRPRAQPLHHETS